MRNWLINTEKKTLEYYKGIQVHADTGLHEQAADLFQRHIPLGASVLDVGAGAGAFSQRLQDLGYSITALDVDPDKWLPDQIPFSTLNIDKGIKASIDGTFDAVSCLEVIEHVENPWNLLREIYSLVKPGGHLVLSTPNVSSFYSRVLFLRTGRFHQFDFDNDLSYGHINPISAPELEHAAAQTGWSVVESRDGGYLPIFDLTALRPVVTNVAINVLSGLTYLMARGRKQGWCLFFVLQRPEA